LVSCVVELVTTPLGAGRIAGWVGWGGVLNSRSVKVGADFFDEV